MEKLQQLAQIQEKLKQQRYRLTSHAEQERGSDRITIEEIEGALLSHQAEVIEGYKESEAMRTCYFCQGEVINKRIRHVHHWADEIVIFENVPAEACTQCGEVYFTPEVLEMMDKATLKRTPPDKSIAVPVFSLP